MSDRPLPISELLRRVGDDNVGVQNLFAEGTFIAANKRKGYTELSFAGPDGLAEQMFTNTVKQTAVVLWIDNDKLKRAKADHRDGIFLPLTERERDLLAAAKGGHWPAMGPGCKPDCPLCAAIARAEGRS